MPVSKPVIGEQGWGEKLNAALDSMDVTVPTSAAAKTLSGTYVPLAGDATITGTKTIGPGGKIDLNGGYGAHAFDVDMAIRGVPRENPTVATLGLYVQHRMQGLMPSGITQEAAALELRVNTIDASGAALIGAEFTTVITGGACTIADLRGATISGHFEGTPSGTITKYTGMKIQNLHALSGTLTVTEAYGLIVDQQTRAATNYTIYAPAGKTVLGVVDTTGDITMGSASKAGIGLILSTTTGTNPAIYLVKGGNNRWILWTAGSEGGSNTGSDFQFIARSDTGTNLGTALTITRANRQVTTGAALMVTGSVGFYGTNPVAKPEVTGSHGGNAALISLLNALASQGLITNSSTI